MSHCQNTERPIYANNNKKYNVMEQEYETCKKKSALIQMFGHAAQH